MPKVERWPREAWIPLVSGLVWLGQADGLFATAVALPPGCLLVGAGVAMLLMPGDRRISQLAALGGFLGVLLALPALFALGFWGGLLAIAAAAASFVAAGHHTVRLEPNVEEVPAPDGSLSLAAQVACDEALLAGMSLWLPLPSSRDNARIGREVREALELFGAQGWLEKPESYHVTPPPLSEPRIRARKVRGIDFEHLAFESDYEPQPEEPGRERWLGYAPNRSAHAWVLRHPDEPRPWVLCFHGFQMGAPRIDLLAFAPEYFHRRLGLNMVLPILPLHGPRTVGKRSGDGFIIGDMLDTVHAEAQAMWDARRLLSWVRAQGETEVAVLGLSLGGYNAALLACLDRELACVVPGIPLTDFHRAIFRHGPPLHLRDAVGQGVDEAGAQRVTRVVSPLALTPRVPRERRYLFGGVADRLVTPDQVRDLWLHWERPRMVWYQGGHLTFRAHRAVRQLVRDALREGGLSA